MLTGNKGEWSEIYTLLKIISDGDLYIGDGDLRKVENLIYPIIKILREESNGTFEYSFQSDLVIIRGGTEEFKIPIRTFKEKSIYLLEYIKNHSSSSFSVPIIENFINSFNCNSLKAKSSVKSDIKIIIHDQKTGQTPVLGFSIKSQLGSPSTLLNAGKTTNFIYEISNASLTENQIENVNNISTSSKIKDRIKQISLYNGRLNFLKTESAIFENNLTLIDSGLPIILSEMLKLFFSSEFSRIKELVEEISKLNPIGFNQETNHPFYSYKIKRFLSDIALGMMPSVVWTGQLDTTGGYLVVKEDGEVLCYHIFNRNEFEDYLYNNTKFETASSTRHDFGRIFKYENRQCFKLNLQIRFLK